LLKLIVITYEKIKTLINAGTTWKDNKELFSLIYQKKNLNLDDLDLDNDTEMKSGINHN